MEGTFALYHPKLKVQGEFSKKDIEEPAILIPRHAVFGDYQILEDRYPECNFCLFVPGSTISKEVIDDLGEDAHVEVYKVMCLQDEVLLNLCELYPESKESLKLLGLKKRKMFVSMFEL